MHCDNLTNTDRNRGSQVSGERMFVLILAGSLLIAGAGCQQCDGVAVQNTQECHAGDRLAGEWVGEMTCSSGNAARRITAIYEPVGEDTYRARYHATMGVGIPLRIAALHHVSQTGDGWCFDEWTQADVPGLGDCRCRAEWTGSQLVIRYRGDHDFGTIRLQRAPVRGSRSVTARNILKLAAR